MIKYRTANGVIAALEITKQCPNTVTISNRSVERKRSPLVNWHDTWDEAKAFLLVKAIDDVKAARLNLMRASTRAERVRKLSMPQEAKLLQ